MTSSAFIFPDPAVTPEFTASNGITYLYDTVDNKWIVKSSGLDTQYLPLTGGIISIDGGTQLADGNLTLKEGVLSLQGSNPLTFSGGNQQTITLSENTAIKFQPTIYGGGTQGQPTSGCFEIGVQDTSRAYVKFPYKINLDTNYETGINATKIARMYLNTGSFYFYKGADAIGSPASNILTIFNRNGNGMEAWAPIIAKVYSGDKPGIVISAETNTNSTWNQPKAGQLKFATYSGNGNPNGHATGILIGGGHTSPQFTFSIEPYGVSQYQIFETSYSASYGKRMYIYPDYSNPNLPDETPVNIKYLKENGLVTTATYTSAAGQPDDNGDATTILTQTNASIPAQCEFDGRTSVGRGFTLQGCTTDQPTNTSAVCLDLYHPITAAAQLLYKGDTTGDNDCVQTKASTEALIQSKAVTLGVKEFQNHAGNTGSTLTGFFLADYIKSSDDIVQLMVSAKDDNNIVVGDVVCVLPQAYRPATSDNSGNGYLPVFTLVNSGSNPTFTAQCAIKTDGSIVFISVGGSSQNFYGQCIFSTRNPG